MVAGFDCIAVGVAAAGIGQHDARTVIARKDERAFDGAGCQDDLAGADPPKPLARQVGGGGWIMVGDPLEQANIMVVIEAERGGARQQGYIIMGGEFVDFGIGPLAAGQMINHLIINVVIQKRAAEPAILLHQDHPFARFCRSQRCHDAGGAAADDQAIAMGVAVGIMVGIGFGGRLAKARSRADFLFIRAPGPGRPHEGFVVEAGRQEGGEAVVDCADIEAQIGPAVLAPGIQFRFEFDGGGPHVRIGPAIAALELDERVGFF